MNKRIVLLFLLILGLVVLAACDSDDEDEATTVPATAVGETATEEVTEVATVEATEEATEVATEEAAEPTEEVAEPTEEVAEPTEEAAEPTEEATEVAAFPLGENGLPDLGGITLTVAVENAYPPFNYYDADGNGIGWDYDVIRELCVRLNCEPEFVETSWDGMLLAISNGEYDMAADGITITAERAEQVAFSEGYIGLEQKLLVRADEDRFTTAEEFVADEELLLGTQPGTTNFAVAEQLLGEGSERIVPFETFPFAVLALIAGDVDAVIADDVAGQGYVGTNPDSVMLLPEELSQGEELGFIFQLESPLVAPINAGLDSMREDGSLQEFNDLWFGPESPANAPEATPETTAEATPES